MSRQHFGSRKLQQSSQKLRLYSQLETPKREWLESWKRQRQFIKDWPFYVKIALWWSNDGPYFHAMHTAIFGSSNPEATALFRKKYRQHNERVQAVISAERLLVYNVKQGWHFLDANFPPVSFRVQTWVTLWGKRSMKNTQQKPNLQ